MICQTVKAPGEFILVLKCKTKHALNMQNEPVSGKALTIRFPESMVAEAEEAMKVSGVMKISDFVRQAVFLRIQEIKATVARRANLPQGVSFARRPKRKAA